MSDSLRRPLYVALVLLLVGAGLTARLARAPEILAEDGPHLIPSDSHYYLRFAKLQEGAFPSFRRFDPLVNFPTGAEILWPPIHTWLVRAAILAGGSANPPEVGAVWVGPFCFLMWVLLLAGLTRRWHGAASASWMVAALALAPLAVRAGELGQLDHHVHEGPWIALILLLAHRMALRPGPGTAIGLGVALTLGRLLTTSGFLGMPLAALALVGAAVLRRGQPASDGTSGWRCGLLAAAVTAMLQLATAWAWGSPGSLDYTQLGGFHPLWTVACFGGALGIAALLEGPVGRRRAFAALGVAMVAGASILLSLRAGVGDALRADAVLASASESRPLWGDPVGAMSLLGQGWLLWGIAGLWAARGVTGDPERTRALRLALALTVPMLLISLVQVRLTRLGLGAMAFSIALALPSLVSQLATKVRQPLLHTAGALLLLLSLALLRPGGDAVDYEERHLRPTLQWIAEHTPAHRGEPDWAVLSTWTFGHLITAWSERAAIATPFSQAPVHVAGNARALEIVSEPDDERAFRKAQQARVRYVLAAPYRGTVGPREREERTLMARLLEDAGMRTGEEGSAHFRLIHESVASRDRAEGGPLARVFEVVPGARLALRGPPGAAVTLELALDSGRGTSLAYRRKAELAPDGRAILTVPYPTDADPHATVAASGSYRLWMSPPGSGEPGTTAAEVDVTTHAVRFGQTVEVELGTPTGPIAGRP